MKYVTGVHALNIPCNLDTTGDWHRYGIQWQRLNIKESMNSVFDDYGIEINKTIPFHSEKYHVANHIRALLDLISDGDFSLAQGMRRDFIGNDNYNIEIFEKVVLLKDSVLWQKIYAFMAHEYYMHWVKFIKEKNLC